MAKRFSFNERVSVEAVTPRFSFVRTVIADTAIAAANAADKPAVNSGGEPTNGTSKARKDGSIIATVSGGTVADKPVHESA
jgi:hypothetical protein